MDHSHCWHIYKIAQTLCCTMAVSLKENIHLPYDPATLLLGINPREVKKMYVIVSQLYL